MPETEISNTQSIILGDEVRDTVSGFTGIAIARTTWLHGCARIGVEARELRDGKPIETHWCDELRLVVTQRAAVPAPTREELFSLTGGARTDSPTHRCGEGR